MRKYFFLIITLAAVSCNAQQKAEPQTEKTPQRYVITKDTNILPGAYNLLTYLPLLENKRVAVVANQTSMINNTHLIDTLKSLKINIQRVFAPEHGFRGDVEAGGKVNDSVDVKTGIKITSLYGKHLKPKPEDLTNIDMVVFDIQDVGARFYTYISTLQYVMEACAENKKKLIVLDRPNPNGFYIDGPVLETKFKSFVGMQQIPVVYGMTIGEYAQMINSEGWLLNGVKCNLKIIPCANYDHSKFYELPVPPSPNLPNMAAVYWYPSLCLFEGTPISIGRGTDYPFQVIGFPSQLKSGFTFIPESRKEALKPPFENQICSGTDLRVYKLQMRDVKQLQIKYVINYYFIYPEKEKYFTDFFNKLAGNETLQMQIKSGISVNDIRMTWQADIDKFKVIRKKYLLYKDFE